MSNQNSKNNVSKCQKFSILQQKKLYWSGGEWVDWGGGLNNHSNAALITPFVKIYVLSFSKIANIGDHLIKIISITSIFRFSKFSNKKEWMWNWKFEIFLNEIRRVSELIIFDKMNYISRHSHASKSHKPFIISDD